MLKLSNLLIEAIVVIPKMLKTCKFRNVVQNQVKFDLDTFIDCIFNTSFKVIWKQIVVLKQVIISNMIGTISNYSFSVDNLTIG